MLLCCVVVSGCCCFVGLNVAVVAVADAFAVVVVGGCVLVVVCWLLFAFCF